MNKAGVTYCYGYMAGCTDSNRRSGVKTTSDGATYAYDANGNIASGAGRTYVWNSDNRLDQVTGPGGSAVMTYDYTGIRIKKTGSSGTSYFPFTGYEVQGGTVTKYVRIGDEIIASKQGATKRFYHNDHLGGVNIISDIDRNQVQLTEYDPWGKVSLSFNIVDLTHRFTGQELDSESDIYYYGGRYYSQALGRFVSPDPFVQDSGDPQNRNRYSYVLNLPQNYVDPSGYFLDWLADQFKSVWSFFGLSRWDAVMSQNTPQFGQNAAANTAVSNADRRLQLDVCMEGFDCGPSGGSTEPSIYKRSDLSNLLATSVGRNPPSQDALQRPSISEYDVAVLVAGPIAGRGAKGLGEAAGPASSAANAVRLRNQLASQQIAYGQHAFEKHVLGIGNDLGPEFTDLGIKTRQQFATHIESVMNDGFSGQLNQGRSWFYSQNSNTIVIRNPNVVDVGSAYRIDKTKFPNPLDYIKTLH